MCKLCGGQDQILVQIPEQFLVLVTEPGCTVLPEIRQFGYPMDCACLWRQPAGKQFKNPFFAQAYHDVSSVLLGTATSQEWFNCLSSCEDGYMSDHSDQFAAAHGLSTAYAPY